MEIKLDQSTLPEDGQLVEFLLYHEIWCFGEYVASENLFVVNAHEYYSAWIVLQWKPARVMAIDKETKKIIIK